MEKTLILLILVLATQSQNIQSQGNLNEVEQEIGQPAPSFNDNSLVGIQRQANQSMNSSVSALVNQTLKINQQAEVESMNLTSQATHPNQPQNQSDFPKDTTKQVKPAVYCGKQAFERIVSKRHRDSKRQMLVSTIHDFDMYVDRKDSSVSAMIALTGTWQPHYINLIGHLVKPGDNVLNLGSQSGLEAIIMGKIIYPNGSLFIFQPYSFSNQLLKKNIKLNGLQEITTVYKIGASDEKSKGIIKVHYSNTGGSQITVKNDKINSRVNLNPRVGQMQQVEMDTVDNLLPQNISLNFALIDIEKMQVKALKGMKNIIQRSPNLVIMTEWQHGGNRLANREETKQLLEYLKGKGYRIYTYYGGDIMRCKIGQFSEIAQTERLYHLNFIDLFLFPKTVELPK